MKVAFRVDASLEMGTGHVMRCLTLADALKAQGAECHFICREHPGNLLALVRQRGYGASALSAPTRPPHGTVESPSERPPSEPQEPAHKAWLGTTWQADAQETETVLSKLLPDWLVVDHYAIDQRWEEALAPHYRKLMVIDDLADRPHRCDLLLDQNLGRQAEHYASLVPAHCRILAGPCYALLRPEFAALRPYSLERRKAQPNLRQLLITMGGVDQPNATGQVLQALKGCALPDECRITVVMGLTAPWLESVRELALQMPWPTDVVFNVSDMAQRMADSDLAIGAAGSTSWERCCLGLPTLMVVLADNQIEAAAHLQETGAADLLEINDYLGKELEDELSRLTQHSKFLVEMSTAASMITDGHGVDKSLYEIKVNNPK